MKQSVGAKALAYPTPVWVIATYDDNGRPNAMTAAWAGICCSKPPCIGVSLRKATYTYGNIIARECFTVNIASEQFVKEVDYLGLVSGRDVDKFEGAKLTATAGEFVDAPYVAEFPMVLECRLIHTLEVGLHTHFVGEILDVKADEEILGDNGLPDIEKLRPVIFAPDGSGYFGVGQRIGKAFHVGESLKEKRSE